jgi:hypothetical protein
MAKQLKLPFGLSQPDPPENALLDPAEKFLTFRKAAKELNVPYHVVQKAAKKGIIPTYNLMGARRYVRLVDILTVMKAA